MVHFNFNKIILGGRLTADPELKQTNSGVMVTSVGLAVSRRFSKGEEQQTDFFNLVAWRGMAEFLSKYFKKGLSVCVVGALQIRNYTDTQGAKRTAFDVVVDEAYFVDGKGDNGGGVPFAGDSGGTLVPSFGAAAVQPGFEPVQDDEDLPF